MLKNILRHKKIAIAAILLLIVAILFMPPRQSWRSGDTTVSLSRDRTTLTISGKGAMEDYKIFDGGPPYIAPNVSLGFRLMWQNYMGYKMLLRLGMKEEPSAILTYYSVTDLVIGKGVTHIGSYTFDCFHRLKSLTVPGNVKSIGYLAFELCNNMTDVTFEDGVKSVGQYAFIGCTRLTSVTVPNSIESIDSLITAFSGCTRLTSITAAADNQRYSSEDGVLFNKDKTALLWYPQGKKGAYTIPSGVKSIGDLAFSGDTVTCFLEEMFDFVGHSGITSITIPDSTVSIGAMAFAGCVNLKSITIPGGISSVGKRAFERCLNLISIEVAADNADYRSENGVLFNKEKTVLIRYPPGKQDTSYTIPKGVKFIEDEAFSHCGNLVSVTIPNGVKSIGDYAFSNCDSLTSITLPSSVDSIGVWAFYESNGLTSVTCLNPVPPVIRGIIIGYSLIYPSHKTCLYVPQNSVDAYLGDTSWNTAKSIKAIGATDNL